MSDLEASEFVRNWNASEFCARAWCGCGVLWCEST